jgi:lipoate-protein ligase A
MALDQAILEAVESGLAPPTLRIYEWPEAVVTVGRFQSVDKDLDVAYCHEHEIPIIRRPTGGRAILHGADLTVSIAARSADLGGVTGISATYRRLSEGFRLALRSLGVEVEQGTCEKQANRSGDCFQTRSVADLVTSSGDKLIGCALRRSVGAILVQASIRHRPDEADRASIFRQEQTTFELPLGEFEAEDISDAIRDGFEALLACNFASGSVSGWEEERAAVIASGLVVG